MRPGESLCMISDGVTEAQNATGDFYGGSRVQHILLSLKGGAATAHAVVEALRTDVELFTAGAEPADDVTILVLRWHGAHGAG
jgi:serine phosphatase RsbU (regulator of sigma subunit)